MHPSYRSLALAAAFVSLAASASADNFTVNPNAPLGNPGPARGVACGTEFITQSTSQAITPGNSVSCNTGGIHADNSYFRAYDVSGFATGLDICEIEVGVEEATSGGATQPITVTVYSHSGAAFPAGTLTSLGSTNFNLSPTTGSIVPVPLTASVPAGTTTMVVEVFSPDGDAGTNSFFIGSNAGGQSAPSYLASADCGITAPTPTSAIGFPNMHIVLNAVGNLPTSGGGLETTFDVAVPTLTEIGIGALVAALALAGLFLMRRSS